MNSAAAHIAPGRGRRRRCWRRCRCRTIFESWTWLVQCVIAVGDDRRRGRAGRALAAGPALGARRSACSAACCSSLTWLFPSGDELLGADPDPGHVRALQRPARRAPARTCATYGVPVADRDGLLFLTALGVGAVAHRGRPARRRPAPAGAGRPADARHLLGAGRGLRRTASASLPFVLGAAGFLWLLVTDNVDRVRRFGRRFTGDGRDVDVWEPSPLAAAGRRLAVVGVVVAVLLPLAVPGMTTGLLDRFGTGVGDGAGHRRRAGRQRPGQPVRRRCSGELIRDETYDMVRVTTNDPNPFYLRFGVADELTADGFVNRAAERRAVAAAACRDPPAGPAPGVTRPAVPGAGRGRSNFDDARCCRSTRSRSATERPRQRLARTTGDQQVVYSSRAHAPRASKYTLRLRPRRATRRRRCAPRRPLPHGRPDPAAATPRVPRRCRRSTDLVDRADRGQDDAVRQGPGDLRLLLPRQRLQLQPDAPSRAPAAAHIVDFLHNKRGFCEQYAAAMAWLVRAAGIPARVAFGFTRGSTPQRQHVHADQPQPARLDRGLLRRLRLGAVRRDARPPRSPVRSRSAWAPDPTAPQPTRSPPTRRRRPAGRRRRAGAAAPRPDRRPAATSSAGGGGADGNGRAAGRCGRARRRRWSLLVAAACCRRCGGPLLRRRRHRRAPVAPAAAGGGRRRPGRRDRSWSAAPDGRPGPRATPTPPGTS